MVQKNTAQPLTALQRKVLLCLRDHPLLSYKTVAAYCECSVSYVKKMASQYHMTRKSATTIDIPKTDLEPNLLEHAKSKNKLATAQDVLTDPEILDRLSYHTDAEIRYAVAANWEALQSTVDRLVLEDTDGSVRAQCVTRVSADILPPLLDDSAAAVRRAIPYHLECTDSMREQLLHDLDAKVRYAAVRYMHDTSIQAMVPILSDISESVRVGLARNTNNSPELLLELLQDPYWKVRNYAAAHENFPRSRLLDVAEDLDPKVRSSLARHCHLPDDIYALLCEDNNMEVLTALATNECVEGRHLDRLIERSVDLTALGSEDRILLKAALAENCNISLGQLHEWIEDDPHPKILEGIASNWMEADMADLLHQIAYTNIGNQDIEFAVADNYNTALRTHFMLSKSSFKDVRAAAGATIRRMAGEAGVSADDELYRTDGLYASIDTYTES